jgi:chromate reductase, NAD(P)H dehydrogenase (quinone)
MSTRLLIVPGSTRANAFSKQLARAATAIVPEDVPATLIDLRDYDIPLYDGDLEDDTGMPAGAVKLREVVKDHDAILFASPEYNASIPAVLKNTIDWVSRPYAGDPDVQAWAGRVCGLLASSPGALGGLRGLVHLRQVAMNVGMQVVSEQFALSKAHEAFAEDGSLRDERSQRGVRKVISSVIRMTRALKA